MSEAKVEDGTMASSGEPASPWALRFKEAWLADGVWSDELAEGVLRALASPSGKRVLRALIEDTAAVPTLRFDTGYQKRLDDLVTATGSDLREQLKAVVDTVNRRIERAGALPDAGTADDAGRTVMAQAASILVAFGEESGVPAQLLEALDDVKLPSLEGLGGPLADGVVAAAAGFVISATTNADRYRRGRMRWDDAIDATTCDTVKAGLSGVILSAIAGAVAAAAAPATGPAAPGVALAAVALLSPVVYAVVGEAVDFVYVRLLGGDAVLEARQLHVAYLEQASFMKEELWPRIRRMHMAGTLVSRLHALERLDDPEGHPARTSLLTAAREKLTDFQKTARPSALAKRLTTEYEARVVKHYEQVTGTKAPATADGRVTYSDIAAIERAVHEQWWARRAVSGGYAKVDPDRVFKDISDAWTLPQMTREKQVFVEKIVRYCCKVEKLRTAPGLPLRYRTRWRDGKTRQEYYVHASTPSEFVHVVAGLQLASGWSHALSNNPELVDSDVYAPLDAPRVVATSTSPSVADAVSGAHEINRFYTKDLYDRLRSGRYRLFEYGAGQAGVAATYLAAPANEDNAKGQAGQLAASLRAYHPIFRKNEALVSRLAAVDVSARSNEDQGLKFMLACLGLGVIVLDVYTATFRIADAEANGTRVVTAEGYFASLDEAKEVFKSHNQNATVLAVRPGPKVLSDTLRRRAHAWSGSAEDRDSVFALQNELLGRLGEGLILLDQLANQAETGVANLAGAGVFLSWWWSLTGRSRRELIEALRDGLVQQALRAEIMEALLAVQRIHVLSHQFFHGTENAAVAKASQDEADAKTTLVGDAA